MFLPNSFRRLQFKYNLIFNNNIRKIFPNSLTQIIYFNGDLTFSSYSFSFKFQHQSIFVYFFKKSKT